MEINLRVYGIVIRNNHVLLSKEFIQNTWIVKFPGGGVHPEESLSAALSREFKEEMACTVKEVKHFYTTDAHVPSWFNSKQRVLSVFYTLELNELMPFDQLILPEYCEHELFWAPLQKPTLSAITLPIEHTVFKALLQLNRL